MTLTLTSSVDFKTLVTELRARGVDHYVLDLGECVTMDSTFLGVLAGLALRNSDGKEIGADGQRLKLDLLNPNAQDLRGSASDFCGQISNLRFGQNILTNTYDPALLAGWGVRASDWSLGLSVQQQLLPRMSIEVAYQRRWFNGFTLNDNLLTKPSDYSAHPRAGISRNAAFSSPTLSKASARRTADS